MDKIVILAAGKGKRMHTDKPKVLVEISGKPMIIHLLEAVSGSGVDSKPVIVVSPDNQAEIRQALSGFDVLFAVQTEQLGTGHAVACAIGELKEQGVKGLERILVFNGDHPFVRAETIKKLAACDSGAAMLTTAVDSFDGWQQIFYHWGRIIKEGGRVSEIIEFKDAPEEVKSIKDVNPAMYCFGFEWLESNIRSLSNNNAQGEFYLTDLIKVAFRRGIKIAAISANPKEVVGINSREELELAESLATLT